MSAQVTPFQELREYVAKSGGKAAIETSGAVETVTVAWGLEEGKQFSARVGEVPSAAETALAAVRERDAAFEAMRAASLADRTARHETKKAAMRAAAAAERATWLASDAGLRAEATAALLARRKRKEDRQDSVKFAAFVGFAIYFVWALLNQDAPGHSLALDLFNLWDWKQAGPAPD